MLARLPTIEDDDLRRLAAAWRNSRRAAVARAAALSPDAPLVVDLLSAFETVSAAFAEDLDGTAPDTTTSPEVTRRALNAVRDVLAAAFARPTSRTNEYLILSAPWYAAYPGAGPAELDLGPNAGRIRAVLEGMGRLTSRCHDVESAALYASLVKAAGRTRDLRHRARDEAWRAAVLTSRRRLWSIVRRMGAAAYARGCGPCRRRHEDETASRVRDLCLDAACALLVADAVDDTLVEILTVPAQPLLHPTPD